MLLKPCSLQILLGIITCTFLNSSLWWLNVLKLVCVVLSCCGWVDTRFYGLNVWKIFSWYIYNLSISFCIFFLKFQTTLVHILGTAYYRVFVLPPVSVQMLHYGIHKTSNFFTWRKLRIPWENILFWCQFQWQWWWVICRTANIKQSLKINKHWGRHHSSEIINIIEGLDNLLNGKNFTTTLV